MSRHLIPSILTDQELRSEIATGSTSPGRLARLWKEAGARRGVKYPIQGAVAHLRKLGFELNDDCYEDQDDAGWPGP